MNEPKTQEKQIAQSKTSRKEKRRKRPYPAALPVFALFSAYLLGSLGIYVLSRHFPDAVYTLYTRHLYQYLTLPNKLLAGLFPFSVSEMLLILALVAFLAGLALSIAETVKRIRKKRPHKAGPVLILLLALYGLGCLLGGNFVWLGGLNYNSLSYKETGGYTVEETDKETLAKLCRYLGQKAGEARSLLSEDADGVLQEPRGLREVLALSRDGYEKLKEDHACFDVYTVSPKPALFSEIMCYEQISGIFPIVYTESLVNARTPAASAPHTACHEIAHQYGFMREDEANFIGFLACINNDDPAYIYSGYYTAFSYAMNQLYRYDQDVWYEIATSVSPGIYRDIAYENDFWDSYEKKAEIIASVSESVNNTYLQMNNIEDGTHSYGRMVDLLIAEYREILG